jgi:Uma2 family endonuclease
VIGPASLVIEVVSQGSIRADYIEKRREYQLGGVPEYWLFDPIKQATLFLRLNESGVYDEVDLDAEGVYTSAVLAGFKLPVHILWQEPLPSLSETLAIVAAMK